MTQCSDGKGSNDHMQMPRDIFCNEASNVRFWSVRTAFRIIISRESSLKFQLALDTPASQFGVGRGSEGR
jgi:hypothetical protein